MGNADAAHGLREFVVGTGGESSRAFTTLLPNSEARNTGTHGIIRLTLNAGGFDWEFVPQAGKSFRDSGSASCHFPDPLDTVAPGVPQDVTALAPSPDQIRLSWRAATDDLGVTGYEIERNGVPLMTLAPSTMFTDDSVFSGVGYTYRVRARDRGGNWSSYSSPATVTTPVASSRVFDDGFESGDLTRWTRCTNVTIANQGAYTGGFAARAASTGLATYCQKTLDQADTELYYRARVKVVSVGANAVDLMMLRTSTGALIASVYRTTTGKLALYNGTSKASLYSPTSIVTGSWYELQLRVRVDGTAGSTEVWSNGTKIAELSQTQNVGTTSIGQLQLGGTTTGRTYELVFDDIAAAGAFIAP